MHDHDVVEIKGNRYPVLPDTDEIVPIHLVTDPYVLMPDTHWSVDALEQVIGAPGSYASRTVRVFVVLSNCTTDDLRIDELTTMLDEYADEHDLNVKLTYYPGTKSQKEYFNARNDDPNQQRISIDILTTEIIDFLRGHGHAGIQIMHEMHLACETDDLPTYDLDFHWLARRLNLRMVRNTEYDYNTLVIHFFVGSEQRQSECPISMLHYRAA
jgi:hypothetical protein